jgi:hypothetical protein
MATSNSSSNSSSSSQNWDYASGQDAAHKKAEELAQLGGSRYMAAVSDPLSIVASGNRIRQLQDYLAAYRGGYGLPDQEVIPGERSGRAASAGIHRTATVPAPARADAAIRSTAGS